VWIFPFLVGLSLSYALSGMLVERDAPPPLREVQVQTTDQKGYAEARERIMDKNILGLEVPAPPKPEEKKQDTGPDPRMWRVAGVVLGEKIMVILDLKDKTRYLMPGETHDGWTLRAARPDGVEWIRDNTILRSQLKGEDAKQVDYKDLPPVLVPLEMKETVGAKITLNRQEILPMLRDPSKILSEALFKPFTKDGQVQGFKLKNIKGDSMLQKVGLQNGDILLRINGAKVDGPKALMKAYSGLERAHSVTLDTLRRDKVVSILVELK
jgi:general secretion pathway protein C